MKSLDAVIRSYEVCKKLDCKICPYNNHDFPQLGEYASANCDSENQDEDALYYLKEYKDRQNDLEKEIAYWQKQNDIVVDLVNILKAQKVNVLCKDCKYYQEDVWKNVYGVDIIVAHHLCTKWGGGCATKPDGYCFMGEKKECASD